MYLRITLFLLLRGGCAEIPRAQPPRLLTAGPGVISLLLPATPQNAQLVELQVRDCPIAGTGEFRQLALQSGDSPVTLGALQPDAVCIFRARGVPNAVQPPEEEAAGAWSFFIPFRAAKTPTWTDSQELTMTRVGATTVRVSWPQPDNGGSAMTGYVLSMGTTMDGTFTTLLDGRTLPTVHEFLVSKLEYSTTYYFKVYAFNKVGTSSLGPLVGVYTVGASVTADPSRLQDWDVQRLGTLQAGELVNVTVTAYHPRTGLAEYLGGDCTIAQDPNCVPGRMFACWLQDLCEINEEGNECVRQMSTGRTYVAGTLLPEEHMPLPSRDLQNGSHVLSFTPMHTGNYSLVVQALWSASLLGNYYDNPLFTGSPADTKADSHIDHDWGTKVVTRYSSDFVSIRWTGFVRAEHEDSYTFYCQADDYCRVYLNHQLIIDAFSDDKCCGEFYSEPLQLTAGQFYPLKVEYVERSGTASVALLWSSTYYQPKEVIQARFLYRGAFLKNAPFTATVVTGKFDPRQSTVFGENLFFPSTKGMNEFYVQVRDQGGNVYDRTVGNREFFVQAHFTQIDGAGASFSVYGSVFSQQLHDGVYVVNYGLTEPGDYRVRVTVDNVEVSNSPVVITAI